jgi:serine/threonine-protein kinase
VRLLTEEVTVIGLRARDGLAVAALVLVIALASLFSGCGKSAPAIEMSAVPRLAGLTPREASDLLHEAGLQLGETRETYADAVPAGKIISTTPSPDEELERGSAVDLAVSKGPEIVPVPALLGSAEADALGALRAQGFLVEVLRSYNESVGAGLVCAMEPAPSTSAQRGSKVILNVSQGSAYVTCGTCGGDGKITTTVTCPECGGSGVCYT